MVEALTRYVPASDGTYVAYQVTGAGPLDILVMMGHGISVEDHWELPRFRRFLERLGEYARVIRFDRRGTGLSDAVATIDESVWEHWTDDAAAVVDAIGVTSVDIVALETTATPMSLMLAATSQRVRRLVMLNPAARYMIAEDYPWGMTVDQLEESAARILEGRITGENLPGSSGAHFDPELLEWWNRSRRRAMGPSAQAALGRAGAVTDLRSVLSTLAVPTLVLSRDSGARIGTREQVRDLVDRLSDATLVELEPELGAHFAFLGDSEIVLAHIEQFLTGSQSERPADRVLATVLFTDLVESTRLAASDGDRRWRERLDAHDAMVRGCLEQYRGREIKTMGDGFLAVFDGPARAIACARAIVDGGPSLGLRVRTGIHTGEIELRGADVTGIAVTIGARVASLAGEGEILVSRTVVDLVAGSPIRFTSRGDHLLKGIDHPWQIFAVDNS